MTTVQSNGRETKKDGGSRKGDFGVIGVEVKEKEEERHAEM